MPFPPIPVPTVAAALPKRVRILAAEDEPSVRSLVQRVLTEAGHDVTLAASGDEALAIVHTAHRPFDLVLSDVVMPGLTGLELAARLRERDPEQRLLLMSGYSEDLLGEALGEVVLPKPFTADGLRAAVDRALDVAGRS